MSRLILISGGIGAGKSVVCKILAACGFPIYDSDSRAKAIMGTDAALCQEIDRSLSPYSSVSILDDDFKINRPLLASVVFSNKKALRILNNIVHPAVIADLLAWQKRQSGICFVESAIPAESGLREIVDGEWVVDAPEELRIKRVGERNGLSEEKIRERIEAQKGEWLKPHVCTHIITNDNHHSLLLQINKLLW